MFGMFRTVQEISACVIQFRKFFHLRRTNTKAVGRWFTGSWKVAGKQLEGSGKVGVKHLEGSWKVAGKHLEGS